MPYLLNVPSNLLSFEDGGLVFRTNNDTTKTKSVLVLGKSIDGVLDPVAVDINTVESVFGKDIDSYGNKNGGTITTAVNDLYRAGCRDIRAQKISGSVAKTTLRAKEKLSTSVIKKEEVLGLVSGNDETSLTLNNQNIIEDSINIFVDGKILSSNFVYSSETNTVTIPADVTQANANVIVKYSFSKTIDNIKYEESLIIDAQKKVTLSSTPKEGSIVVKLNDVIVPTDSYSVVGNKITFTITSLSEDLKKKIKAVDVSKTKATVDGKSLVVGAIVTIEYLGTKETTEQVTDTQHAGIAYKTATSIQSVVLAEAPNAGSLVLFCNDKEIPKKDYAVSGTTLSIKKENLPFGLYLKCTYLTSENTNITSTINFESFFASEIYNEGYITVSEIKNKDDVAIGRKITITKPKSKCAIGEVPLEYSSLLYPTFGKLVDAIKGDLRNGVYSCNTDFPDELTSNIQLGKHEFVGGDSGINSTLEEIKEALSGKRDDDGYLVEDGIYQALEGYNVDYIVLTGVYADDVVASPSGFDYDLAMHCAYVSNRTKVTYGAIAMKPCKNTSVRGIREYVDEIAKFNSGGNRFLLKENGKVISDKDGKPVDLGMYVRVVGGPEPFYLNDHLGKHPANPAVVYVGLQSSIVPQSSPMNKALTSSKGLRFNLHSGQLASITKAGVICFRTKTDRKNNTKEEAYVFDSMTQALPGSDFVRTTNCEVVRLIGDDIREIGDPFIGEPPTTESKNSFAAALSKRFIQRKEEGAAQDISFEIVETVQSRLMGDSKVKVIVVPFGERREISTTIGLKPML